MKKLRTGIVGCGKVSDFHALAYKNLEMSEFVAVCDADEARALKTAEKYGVRAYTDLEKMIKENDLDVVSVTTPHFAHVQNAITIADCGCNAIIEKPLANTVEDCDRIIEAEKRNNVTMSMIVQRRFYRPCMRIREAIDTGKLGTPIIGTVNVFSWRDKEYYDSDPWRGTWEGEGGGVMATQATHQIDLLLWYFGEVEEVYGYAENYTHPYIEVEDTALATVKFKSGAIANLIMTNCTNPALYGRVAVYGSNGASAGVQTDGGAMFIAGMSEITEAPYNHLWNIPGEENMLEEYKAADTEFFNSVDSMHYYHERHIEEILTAISEGRKPMVSAVDGKNTVQLYTAIHECTKTGRPIRF